MWDRHYHEFEDWQLDWLLEKTGWKIIDRMKFTHPVKKLVFVPLLRWFTNRYYLVYAEKVKSNNLEFSNELLHYHSAYNEEKFIELNACNQLPEQTVLPKKL
jgi:hypothetical protein